MPIQSSAVGTELEPQKALVSLRRTLAYAAGIGDTVSFTFEDDRDDGVVAPPSFCVSLEWAVVIGGRSSSVLGTSADELRRGVHAAQDSTFHRPIRPGDELETRGRIVALQPTRAGTFCLTKLETLDRSSREPVVTTWSTSIYRSVALEGKGRALEEAPPTPPIESGWAPSESVELPISRELPHVYSECARIWNPIHTERSVALAAGLPDIILHGTATWALAGREIVRLFCEGDPTRLRRLSGRFRAMVIPGLPISLDLGRADSGQIRFVVRNHLGDEAISQGLAEVA